MSQFLNKNSAQKPSSFNGFLSVIGIFFLIGCGAGVSDYVEELGAGYIYHSDSSIDKYVTNNGKIVIKSLVTDYVINDRYIAAVSLTSQDYECQPGSYLTQKILDETIYWIFDKNNNSVFSTSDKDKFYQYAEKLGVSIVKNLNFNKKNEILEKYRNLKNNNYITDENCRSLPNNNLFN